MNVLFMFIKVLNMGISAAWLILAVFLMRFALKKAPKWISCVLWGLVAIRLLCPFTIESALSLIPSTEAIPETIAVERKPDIRSELSDFNHPVNSVMTDSVTKDFFASETGIQKNPLQILIAAAAGMWIAGLVLMLCYMLASFLLLKKKVLASIPIDGRKGKHEGNGRKRIFACDEVKTPFILGIIRPVIYVPSKLDGQTLELAVAHEMAHIRRRDHWWKPLGFLILSVYWFHPLCWLAYIMLCRDIEAACDEKVIRDRDKDYVAAYSQALLDLSYSRRMITACPLAFGETGVKERIKGVLNYKKPSFWVIMAAVSGCIVIAVCFLTSPAVLVEEGVLRFLDERILEQNHSNDSEDNFCCSDIQVLKTKHKGGEITVYAWVLYEEYAYSDGKLQEDSGSHVPCVFTVRETGEEYQLEEYWEPRDGEYYVSDIHDKFPFLIWGKAVDSQRYIEGQQARCLKKAEDYYSDVSKQVEEVEIKRPEVNLSDTEGATYTEILYSDKDRLIFRDYYGLFVYSKENRDILTSLDLKAIGCSAAQGDDDVACMTAVSEDGNTIYLHIISSDKMYVYHIPSDSLTYQHYDLDGVRLHKLPDAPPYEDKKGKNNFNIDQWTDDRGRQMNTVLIHGEHLMIGELCYVDYETDSKNVEQSYPLFSPKGLSGAVDFSPEEIHDIQAVDLWINGELHHWEDADLIRQLEEILSKSKKIKGSSKCPFYTALYLTKSDGTVGTIFPATDGCLCYLSNHTCYEIPEESRGMLWKLVQESGLIPE